MHVQWRKKLVKVLGWLKNYFNFNSAPFESRDKVLTLPCYLQCYLPFSYLDTMLTKLTFSLATSIHVCRYENKLQTGWSPLRARLIICNQFTQPNLTSIVNTTMCRWLWLEVFPQNFVLHFCGSNATFDCTHTHTHTHSFLLPHTDIFCSSKTQTHTHTVCTMYSNNSVIVNCLYSVDDTNNSYFSSLAPKMHISKFWTAT